MTNSSNKETTLPAPRIEVFEYLGYNGGFARERIPLFKCVLVGANNERRDANTRSWHGYSEAKYAESEGKDWSEFTGWPLFFLGHVPTEDDPQKP